MASGKTFTVTEVGYFEPGSYSPAESLTAGEVGYIAASIKSLSDIRVGDTITVDDRPAEKPLPGYKKVNPMVYCGLYPVDGSDYENLKVALEKLQLNDAALEYYMIMQSYDFYYMFQHYGCNMQFGGDDQWSNMLGGTELIRRKLTCASPAATRWS